MTVLFPNLTAIYRNCLNEIFVIFHGQSQPDKRNEDQEAE